MAKKPRSGRPQPGGRVTPKGVRPAGDDHAEHAPPAHQGPGPAPQRIAPTHGSLRNGMHAPTRAGHHRGNR